MSVYVSGSSYHAKRKKGARSETAKEHGSNCGIWERETQPCRVDKDNVNLSGVTGAPAAAHFSLDWQIESERTEWYAAVD